MKDLQALIAANEEADLAGRFPTTELGKVAVVVLPVSKGTEAARQLIERELGKLGGYSRYNGAGYWVDADGREFAEPHVRYVHACLLPVAFLRMVRQAMALCDEQAMYCEFDGAAFLVERK